MPVLPTRLRAAGAADPDATRSRLVQRLHNWDDHAGWQKFFDRDWKLIYAVGVKPGLSDAEA